MLKLVLWHRCGGSDLHLFFAYVLLICDLSTRILCTLEFSEGIWKDFPCPWEIELCTVNFYPAVQLPFRFKRRLRLQKDFLFMIAAVRFYHGELWLEKSGNPVSELKICSYQQDKVCILLVSSHSVSLYLQCFMQIIPNTAWPYVLFKVHVAQSLLGKVVKIWIISLGVKIINYKLSKL